eukprot:TRINITY_DN30950_c0_g1_i1.p1 TRINITY_DN30950_c0_g1~~TRINITY_DN30950_c0_g1_i1.p1  ORF type:complete len:323 (+),score=104.77 TRINITY_DN30950_c0_g1_i1:48-1016(+)
MTSVYSPGLRSFTEKDIEVHQLLGEGSYGAVHKVRVKKTGEWMAVKKCGLEFYDHGLPATTMREVAALVQLGAHPNVVTLHGVMRAHEGEMLLCFEFCSGGDLADKLDELTGRFDGDSGSSALKAVPPPLAKHIIRSVSAGLAFLHAHGVMHRDIKPMNVLVDPDCTAVKLCDFGMARSVDVAHRLISREAMTVYYRPPEVLLSSFAYGTAADVWSAGVMFAEVLCCGAVLFDHDTEVAMLMDIFQTLGTPTPATWPGLAEHPDYTSVFPRFRPATLLSKPHMADLSADALDLLQRTVACCPADRLSIDAVLAHPFLKAAEK